jgi:hypothetical protein
LCCLSDESTITVFGEALSLKSVDGIAMTQSDVMLGAGGNMFGLRERAEGHVDDQDDHIEEVKRDIENMSPIDLSITTGTPSDGRNCSVSLI